MHSQHLKYPTDLNLFIPLLDQDFDEGEFGDAVAEQAIPVPVNVNSELVGWFE